MEIGSKLKEARVQAGLTQEVVAEQIGVSRQTISNWENNKSYPDIVSVIQLSDLYAVNLDGLLKEDGNMIKYLEESTNNVKSRQKFSKLILVMTYLLIWTLVILDFWLGGGEDAMGYSLMVFWLILPITTFTISVFIGKNSEWKNQKLLMMFFFGVMYMLAAYVTFSLANGLTFDKINLPSMTAIIPGILFSAPGLLIGTAVGKIKEIKGERN